MNFKKTKRKKEKRVPTPRTESFSKNSASVPDSVFATINESPGQLQRKNQMRETKKKKKKKNQIKSSFKKRKKNKKKKKWEIQTGASQSSCPAIRRGKTARGTLTCFQLPVEN